MPFVTIKLAGKLSKKKKEELGKEVTKAVHKTTGKPTSHIWVHIEDTEREDWIIEGKQLE